MFCLSVCPGVAALANGLCPRVANIFCHPHSWHISCRCRNDSNNGMVAMDMHYSSPVFATLCCFALLLNMRSSATWCGTAKVNALDTAVFYFHRVPLMSREHNAMSTAFVHCHCRHAFRGSSIYHDEAFVWFCQTSSNAAALGSG